jgi:hypothetical protein
MMLFPHLVSVQIALEMSLSPHRGLIGFKMFLEME